MNLDDRASTIYGWIAALLGGGGILYFWVMGAILLFNRTGGQIQFLHDEPVWHALFYAYPIVFVVSIVIGALLVALRRDLLSIGVAGAPVVFAIGYYFALIHFRFA